jgi:hypothetical protein
MENEKTNIQENKTQLKVFSFDVDKEYSKDFFMGIFEENKTTINFKDYYKGEVKQDFIFLEQNKPILISGYPYGYLRTNIKYSVETTNKGGRFVTQTLNPKTQKWNKEHKGTYNAIMFLIVDKDGKIGFMSLDYNDDESKINLYSDLFKDVFNDLQKKEILKIKAYKNVMEKVTFSCNVRKFKNLETGEITESVDCMQINKYVECDDDGNPINKEEEEKKRKETDENINKAMNYEYNKLKNETNKEG